MSKLETVRGLNDSEPQLQIVASVRTLQQAVNLMHEDLKRLPDSVASETAEALRPLTTLKQEVAKILDAYDKVTLYQRKSLDELTQEMSRNAAAAFEQKAGKLDATIIMLSRSLSDLKFSLDSMEKTALEISRLPENLLSATESMTRASLKLVEAANETQPKWWKQAIGLIFAGIISAALVATGQVALNRLVPPSGTQQTADWASTIWSKATDKERALLNQIVERPAK